MYFLEGCEYNFPMTQVLYLSQIRAVARHLSLDHVDTLSGSFHDVVIVNDEWVFRFPRYREGVAELMRETRLLEALRGRLPLPIPDPVYQMFEPPIPGLATHGYRRIPGEPITRAAIHAASEWTRDDLASQLARFLRSLHNIPLNEVAAAFPTGVEAADQRPTWEAMWAETREKLLPAMRPDARRALGEHFEAYLDDPALQAFTPCLRHGDLGGDNILWDAGKGVVTGVVDFTSCAPGDPAADLASLSTLGEDLYSRFAPLYQPDSTRRAALLARARFYRGTFALQEALHGLRSGDQAAYRAGMEPYV
jgi:aminoglycoside 2''-phosphotransferase